MRLLLLDVLREIAQQDTRAAAVVVPFGGATRTLVQAPKALQRRVPGVGGAPLAEREPGQVREEVRMPIDRSAPSSRWL